MQSLTLEQRVGQLFVVGSSASSADAVTLDAVSRLAVGGVFLHGRSSAGVDATSAVVTTLTSASTSPVPVLVATDQEGGQVQVLSGPGFSTMPSALQQGQLATSDLESSAATWGGELHAAGVTLNLAPVLDVPASAEAAAGNAPIGAFDREFGYDAQAVATAGRAFADGMATASVGTVFKHFPGLGLVTQNTDTTANVTDTQTTASSPSVQAFATVIGQGAPWVMVSSAIYTQLDPADPALFSSSIVTDLLRGTLGFTGAVMTDDVSAAEAVAAWSPGDRAVNAIAAGCDVILVSADPTVAAEMVAAVLAKAQSDATFAARVDEAAAHVLAAKS
ncbi:glycoside hydrolase family 3 N-terminal domain-containing protein [Miniimonas arenae]|uniref:glycoside hydrolase family 3 N-terminal domain-containing protein n=1 Tax=Miniimonas arenae TaxID=676201 RepID=UPI001FE39180|nr:glycoside hydrolase family 3 N-terminal domain-containing protein [Miniimonas arenae]